MQGFRKIDTDKWEFGNDAFLRGQKYLLKHISRKKTSPPQLLPADVEVDSLRRDKLVLVMEVVKLRKQQQATRAHLQQMEMRLRSTEKKQKQMMSFLARAMHKPEFIHQLVNSKEKRRELDEAITKKRRRPIKAEPLEASELEVLALEMQGFGKGKAEADEVDSELDDGFWEELLSEEIGVGDGCSQESDVNDFDHKLGFLASWR